MNKMANCHIKKLNLILPDSIIILTKSNKYASETASRFNL